MAGAERSVLRLRTPANPRARCALPRPPRPLAGAASDQTDQSYPTDQSDPTRTGTSRFHTCRKTTAGGLGGAKRGPVADACESQGTLRFAPATLRNKSGSYYSPISLDQLASGAWPTFTTRASRSREHAMA